MSLQKGCEDDHFLYTDHMLGLYFVCKNVNMSLCASNVRKENSLGNLQLSDVLGFSVNFKWNSSLAFSFQLEIWLFGMQRCLFSAWSLASLSLRADLDIVEGFIWYIFFFRINDYTFPPQLRECGPNFKIEYTRAGTPVPHENSVIQTGSEQGCENKCSSERSVVKAAPPWHLLKGLWLRRTSESQFLPPSGQGRYWCSTSALET